MSRATPPLRDFAKSLMAHEIRENGSSEIKSPAAFHALEKLRVHVMILMGNAGFRALLSRALALSCPEAAWLRAVHVKSDGSLEGLNELALQVDQDEMTEGKTILLAQLLGLLVVFIGERLTLQMVHAAWPTLPLDDFDLGKGLEQ